MMSLQAKAGNNAQIIWLTNRKAAWRFLTAGIRKEKLIH